LSDLEEKRGVKYLGKEATQTASLKKKMNSHLQNDVV
jgi:hypothetical protein